MSFLKITFTGGSVSNFKPRSLDEGIQALDSSATTDDQGMRAFLTQVLEKYKKNSTPDRFRVIVDYVQPYYVDPSKMVGLGWRNWVRFILLDKDAIANKSPELTFEIVNLRWRPTYSSIVKLFNLKISEQDIMYLKLTNKPIPLTWGDIIGDGIVLHSNGIELSDYLAGKVSLFDY